MGEIAEMILDGILDCETGEYLGDAVGYPRTASVIDHEERKAARSKRTRLRRERRKRSKLRRAE